MITQVGRKEGEKIDAFLESKQVLREIEGRKWV